MKRFVLAATFALVLSTSPVYADDTYWESVYETGFDAGFQDGEYFGYDNGYEAAKKEYDKTNVGDIVIGLIFGALIYDTYLRKTGKL